MCCFPDIHYMVFIMDFDSERDAMITNHTISWGYIVNRMKNKYGISPDDREKFSMAEINQYIENIWDEYCDEDYGEIPESFLKMIDEDCTRRLMEGGKCL